MAVRHSRLTRAESRFVKGMVVFAIGAFVAAQVFSYLGTHSATFAAIMLAALVVAGGVVYARWQASRKMAEHLEAMLIEHQSGLVSAYRLGVYSDHFGNSVDAKWRQQIDVFLRTKVVPNSKNFDAWRSTGAGRRSAARVDAFTQGCLAALRAEEPQTAVDAAELSPREYEHFCADVFRRMGWAVQETPASRDSGADFVAQRGANRVVVQCKRYAAPVGNKAVQEVNAALKLYSGTLACVVAPNGYTAQAKREAFGLNVHLVDHVTLPGFAKQLEGASA